MYRVNGGAWQTTRPQDGKFDSSAEPFTITMDALETGAYLVKARAADAAGKTETTCARPAHHHHKQSVYRLPAPRHPVIASRSYDVAEIDAIPKTPQHVAEFFVPHTRSTCSFGLTLI